MEIISSEKFFKTKYVQYFLFHIITNYPLLRMQVTNEIFINLEYKFFINTFSSYQHFITDNEVDTLYIRNLISSFQDKPDRECYSFFYQLYNTFTNELGRNPSNLCIFSQLTDCFNLFTYSELSKTVLAFLLFKKQPGVLEFIINKLFIYINKDSIIFIPGLVNYPKVLEKLLFNTNCTQDSIVKMNSINNYSFFSTLTKSIEYYSQNPHCLRKFMENSPRNEYFIFILLAMISNPNLDESIQNDLVDFIYNNYSDYILDAALIIS